jgi:folate-binding protein YgfZ
MSGASETSSFEREYEALRSGRAIVELNGWSSISVTGADRQPFLNNFCTNDVKRLSPGESCEAFFTNVKGKIIGHGVIWCRDDELVFFGAPDQAQRLVEHLDRYIIRENVKVRDATSKRSCLLVTGSLPEGEKWTTFSWNVIGNESARIIDTEAKFAPSSFLEDRKWVSVGVGAFTATRIESGVPLYGVDFDESNFPQEVGRDREAISFTKGCYLGQETVARIDALGHVNQRIVGVAFSGDGLPTLGTELTLAGTKVGQITTAAFSPALNRPLALAMVRREANMTGTRLKSSFGDCQIVELPILSTTLP